MLELRTGRGGAVTSGGTAGHAGGGASAGGAGAGGTISSAGTSSSTGGGGLSSAGGGTAGSAGAGGGANPNPPGKQSLIWIWLDYKNSLNAVIKNKSSFTHVSPALYTLNYDYTSGVPHLLNANDYFDGLSSKAFADAVHAAGLKVQPLMYAGAGNGGTDQGIQNI